MNIAVRVIDKFGGLTAMSRALGHEHCTTVQGWRDSGRIPNWRWPEINEAAKREKIDLADELRIAGWNSANAA